jgi:uncharacterized protein (DUF924 family)
MSEPKRAENPTPSISDEDAERIDAILSFWFKGQSLTAPQIDQRMDVWFGNDPVFDHEITEKFATEVDEAAAGLLDHWSVLPRGRLALILLLDQFRRNIYRGTARAFEMDAAALKLCVEGAMQRKYAGLTPIQQVFFYMPLQHSESRKVQAKSVMLFNRLAQAVSPPMQETFATVAQFAELHHDIIDRFGRFPHRNKLLNRENTPEEDEYLAGDSPDFGQVG